MQEKYFYFHPVLNAGLGIAVFEDGCDDAPSSGYKILHVYFGFLAFLFVFNGLLFFIFTFSAWKAGTREGALENNNTSNHVHLFTFSV